MEYLILFLKNGPKYAINIDVFLQIILFEKTDKTDNIILSKCTIKASVIT